MIFLRGSVLFSTLGATTFPKVPLFLASAFLEFVAENHFIVCCNNIDNESAKPRRLRCLRNFGFPCALTTKIEPPCHIPSLWNLQAMYIDVNYDVFVSCNICIYQLTIHGLALSLSVSTFN